MPLIKDARSQGQFDGYMADPCANCGEYKLLPKAETRECQSCGNEESWLNDDRDLNTRARRMPLKIRVTGTARDEQYGSIDAFFAAQPRR